MYSIVRPLLFRLEAERSHDLVMGILALLSRHNAALQLLRRTGARRTPAIPARLAGLALPNPLGLAAGLDKDACAFPALAALGFGWIELGTVTPRRQPGNPLPRLFRIEAEQALINRMGFNSKGLEPFIENLKKLRRNTDSVVGVNIGKNALTPLDRADEDYLIALDAVYGVASYVAINISSPNTESLRDLQNVRYLDRLAERLTSRREELMSYHKKFVPLFLKIAPDLGIDEIDTIAGITRDYQFDAVIATNTTVTRPEVSNPLYREAGGLSGPPLRDLATRVVSRLHHCLGSEIPIVGVGGIASAEDAIEKIRAGARFLQIYTSFTFQGPIIVRRILQGLERSRQSMQINDWESYTERVRV